MDKNFINFHVLISHSPSCLNRDDMNMQKSAVFGGKRRVRISSQSLKRSIRKSPYYKTHLGETSIRSRNLLLLQNKFVEDLLCEFDEQTIQEAVTRFVTTKDVVDDNDEDQVEEAGTEENPKKKIAVAPWVKDEFKIICRIVKEIRDEGLTEEEEEKALVNFEKQKKPKNGNKKPLEHFREKFFSKKIDTKLKENLSALIIAIGSAKDVALSGRMATSGLMTTVDGAMSMAHSITTHTVDADIDWFTAVDDLQELGSGHLDTQEFSSGVFYRYASLNLGQLQENLGNAPREKALDIAAHLLHLMATIVPSAKQQSFAAHNLADLSMVSFSDIPVSLANAFEEPVKPDQPGGYLKPSINALHEYWQKIHSGYSLEERCGEFIVGDVPLPDSMKYFTKLDDLKKWVRNNGEG
ncbi:MAG: type I-E CRISPR-associated protein Cas7/Cse4/CasC [Victivallales bacterium]|nr:type I-E CRISPR-associated protein Cas7/Cse4/CasC [Desulfobacterales bacterium]MDD4392375.1 type I-E CRISPR-associated protein Cas7/Cse4/CasC [Desulfobacterales bacterium]